MIMTVPAADAGFVVLYIVVDEAFQASASSSIWIVPGTLEG